MSVCVSVELQSSQKVEKSVRNTRFKPDINCQLTVEASGVTSGSVRADKAYKFVIIG